MATHINTTNAIKGLTCAIECFKTFGVNPFTPHAIKHLTDAATEIERLNDEANNLRQRIKSLDSFNSFESKWDSLIFALMGTDAGKNICKEGHDKTTELAIRAIHKTESDRKEATRIAQAFQEAASPKTHQLKILPEYFQVVIEGKKKAELRTNDRDFAIGDYLLLAEWDGGTDEYTGRKIVVEISDITQCDFVSPNLVMLSFFDPCDEIPFQG